jgi:septum site-determining protein MinC
VANSFDIKSSQLPLVALLIKTVDHQQVINDLSQQFGKQSDSPDFFDNDPLLIDFSNLTFADGQSFFKNLIQTLLDCRLKPIAFRGATGNLTNMALKSGLFEAPADTQRSKSTAKSKQVSTPSIEVVREVIKEVVREIPGPSVMVIDKPLRSGQKIYARGTDLVVLAMVNQGAEVVADGNIHVYAPLRGKAMAGASGNVNARIFSLCLEPELISIAGIYRTSEHLLAADIQGKPAQVRLSNDGQDKLLFEALKA